MLMVENRRRDPWLHDQKEKQGRENVPQRAPTLIDAYTSLIDIDAKNGNDASYPHLSSHSKVNRFNASDFNLILRST